jgi:hypothetical protein
MPSSVLHATNHSPGILLPPTEEGGKRVDIDLEASVSPYEERIKVLHPIDDVTSKS